MTHSVSFHLNGERVTIEDPAPDLLLIDWLRSPNVRLTGAKKGCGQGGCGACTVIVSDWDDENDAVRHASINSCLRPVCALGGMSITTVEGTGAAARPAPPYMDHRDAPSRTGPPALFIANAADSESEDAPRPGEHVRLSPAVIRARSELAEAPPRTSPLRVTAQDESPAIGMNPVAHRVAINNGSQCGYCTVGWVMSMSALLADRDGLAPTQREIEDNFDGNICRCTGYRSILTGMKTFASDWTDADEALRMKCRPPDGEEQVVQEHVHIPFPSAARGGLEAVTAESASQLWVTPRTLEELIEIVVESDRRVRLVHGNTSFGIYPDEYHEAEILVDIRLLPDLDGITEIDGGVAVGSGATYSDLLAFFERDESAPPSRFGAAHHMVRRTAGTMVRNAASIGGNTMLVFEHIHIGEPFPSDLLTAMVGIGTVVRWLNLADGAEDDSSIEELVEKLVDHRLQPRQIFILSYLLPRGTELDVALAQKVALREVNSHSIVNVTTRFEVGGSFQVNEAVIVYGGIAPFPWRPTVTEALIVESGLSLDRFDLWEESLRAEIANALDYWEDRLAEVPDDGFTNEYRTTLAVSLLYKAVVNALLDRDKNAVPDTLRSSGETKWGNWDVSTGFQRYTSQGFKAPMGQPFIKLMSMYQASGQVHYTHEAEISPTGLNGAFVTARQALGVYHYRIPGVDGPVEADALRDHLRDRYAGFAELITHDEIPTGGINLQGIGGDQPMFAVDEVLYFGQAISMVLADTEQQAIAIAQYVSEQCVGYGPIGWPDDWQTPILRLEDAIEKQAIFPDSPKSMSWVSHIWKIIRPGSRFDWVATGKADLDRSTGAREGVLVDGVPCVLVESTTSCGAQVHFYMETQACVAEPIDHDRLEVTPSTQSPMGVHATVASALGVAHNQVAIKIRQLGGGFGGKTEQARFVAGPVAVAANAMRRPVRLASKRETDTAMFGHRHPYYGQCQVAIDDGSPIAGGPDRPEDRGRLLGMSSKMWGDGGAFYDCSFVVSNCIQLRADNAYRIPNFANQLDVCRTNTAPNTAMRAFGDIQSTLIIESAIDDAAFALCMDPAEVREKNLYERGDVTPYGQALPYCYLHDVWEFAKDKSRYAKKRADVEEFNKANRWRKQGISMVPVKYGSGYNLVQLEQATAVVSVYQADGSIVIHQGGVDMGQGLITKAEQLAAYVLGVPMHLIHIEGPTTGVIPNPSSTGGSTGTAYNGEAVRQACQDLRSRLREFAFRYRDEHGDAACVKAGIAFWKECDGSWNVPVGDEPHEKLIWQNLVALAHANRVSLVSSFNAKIPGGETPVPALHYRPKDEQHPIPGIELDSKTKVIGGANDSFVGYTYSAACAVVEIDVLTGETKVISADIVYDMGWSLNPAIDIGQVEGAFVQGIGYVLTEALVYQSDGELTGRLNSDNTWQYKPPAITTIPLKMNTHLYPRDRSKDTPEDPNGLFSSKEVGEPPLVLATSVFLAAKAAIRASRVERDLDGFFRFDAPATVQEVSRALDVSLSEHAHRTSANAEGTR